jgi:outer membrane protein OmpA-like peptidoglycan-associated protein
MFSPDGDGVDDELTITIKVTHPVAIWAWNIVILDPGLSPFKTWSGEGNPPPSITWDGLGDSDGTKEPDLVQSASEYHFGMNVVDIYNNNTPAQAKIMVDVLVRRDGDKLRMIVPSIVFPANSSNLDAITDPDIKENNDRILHRIAEILNKEEFSTYGITVEGHANPTTPPTPARARQTEEVGTRTSIGLQPLSEARAKAVVNYLVGLDVDQGRLTAVGMGGTHTVAEFTDRTNWWKNRRVEFILDKPPVPEEPEVPEGTPDEGI